MKVTSYKFLHLQIYKQSSSDCKLRAWWLSWLHETFRWSFWTNICHISCCERCRQVAWCSICPPWCRVCLDSLHGTVESCLSCNVSTNIRTFVSFVLNSIDHTGWHRVWELSVLVRAHCNLDILCLKNWLDGLNLIPRFQIILCKYCVLRASSVIRFRVFHWKVASIPVISDCATIWTWVLIFDTFEID